MDLVKSIVQRTTKFLKNDGDFLLLLLFLTTIIYATSWWNEFVSDDIAGIAQNPSLGLFLLQLKTLSFVNILFSIIYKLFGPTPFWYHLLNTILHLLTVVVIYLLGYVLSEKKTIARIASVLFAIHPIETEGVTWISGAPYASYTFFIFTSLLLFILVEKEKLNLNWIWASALFYGLAVRSSEKAAILPAILFVYLLVFSRITWRNLKLTLPIFTVAFLYGLTISSQFTQRVATINPSYSGGPTLFNPLVQIPIAIFSYIKLLFLPINLTLYHEYLVFSQWQYFLAVALTALLFLSILVFWRRSKLVAFGLALFFISLLPTMLPISIGWVVAERYVHAGSIGIFLVVAVFIDFLKNRLKRSANFSTGVVIFFIIILVPLTIKRNFEWRNQDTLWPATVKVSPQSAYAHNNMGDYYGRHNNIEASIREFEMARRLRPRYGEATHNLGSAYLKINQASKAAELFKEALEYNPTLYQSSESLGIIAFGQKDYAASESYFLKAAKINPDPLVDYLYLYIIYNQSGNKEKAEESLIICRRLATNIPERIQLIQQVLNEYEQFEKRKTRFE